ncbi:hypothetical protein MTR_0058s0010 [Medicago truncatula]|uniref:Uncharacterized protein n=1 Tax=Medicago truncatula TaxID=3880 RepID=A0A072THS7_MEDTR|nr:hypothetical protein MTR_0058s0010 [Medicago truncatula]
MAVSLKSIQDNTGTKLADFSKFKDEFEVKYRAKEVERFFKKGIHTVGNSFKKGWNKIKHLKR